jgi:hypothetical protein
MVERLILQLRSSGQVVLLALWSLGVALVVAIALLDPTQNLVHPAVITSAELVVAMMALAWNVMVVYPTAVRFTRLVWTLGVLTFLFHLVMAFWLAHGWSHNAAVEHVREVGGFGGGILVSYLFALIWFVDAVWSWVNPLSYRNRPLWLGWAIQGFLIFIVLNATVVFGASERRLAYCLVFIALGILWLCRQAGLMKSQ